jgi:hypothetical protein
MYAYTAVEKGREQPQLAESRVEAHEWWRREDWRWRIGGWPMDP